MKQKQASKNYSLASSWSCHGNESAYNPSSDLAGARPPIHFGVIAPGNHGLKKRCAVQQPQGKANHRRYIFQCTDMVLCHTEIQAFSEAMASPGGKLASGATKERAMTDEGWRAVGHCTQPDGWYLTCKCTPSQRRAKSRLRRLRYARACGRCHPTSLTLGHLFLGCDCHWQSWIERTLRYATAPGGKVFLPHPGKSMVSRIVPPD